MNNKIIKFQKAGKLPTAATYSLWLKGTLSYLTGIKDSDLVESKYIPSKATNKNTKYYTRKGLDYDVMRNLLGGKESKAKEFDGTPLYYKNFNDLYTRLSNLNGKQLRTTDNSHLGEYTIGIGQDKNGRYVSYYDKFDWAPKESLEIFSPYEIYNRIYEKDFDRMLKELDNEEYSGSNPSGKWFFKSGMNNKGYLKKGGLIELANARKWKHKEGGIIKAEFGLKLSNTVNKIGDFFNSNTGKGLLNLGMQAFGTIKGSIDANNYSNSFDAETNSLLKAMDASQRKNNYKLASQLASEIIKLKQLENPDIHYGPIDKLLLENQIADSLYDDSEMVKYQVLRALEKLKLMEAIQGSSSGILDTVGGLLGNFMGNKKDTSPNTSSNNSTFGNYVSTLFKNYGTFNSDGSFNTSLGTYKWEDGKIKNISNTYGTFNADGSMNLGGLLGTISINGGYKPRKFGTLMNYT